MPFLFVNYSQGAGGEYFCKILSETDQCVSLESEQQQSRTKVVDKFNQKWLLSGAESLPESDIKLYDVVPCHNGYQTITQAKQILTNVKTIRILDPTDLHLWSFLKFNQKTKVFLKVDPSDDHFVGWIKKHTTDKTDWVKNVSRDMDGLSIMLLSQGIDPTEENKVKHIRQEFNTSPNVVNKIEYDLVIPYEKLILDHTWIQEQLNKVFSINLPLLALSKYYQDYVNYTLNTTS
jgi:hypothetical protein